MRWNFFNEGIPFGLCVSVPLILSSRKVSYADQGVFSFAFWPFAIKLLWAPIVDSVYIRKIGRRKSWILLCITLNGILMISLASYVHNLLDNNRVKKPEGLLFNILN